MYKIYADDTLIYDSTLEDYKIGKGEITLEIGKAGSFVFSMYPDNPFYNNIVKMKTVITVYRGDEIIFRGRALKAEDGFFNCRNVTCEGELNFLLDSIIRPYDFSGAPSDLFKKFVNEHNAQVDEEKRFKVGLITVSDVNNYVARSNINYNDTLTNITDHLLNSTAGGYLFVTHDADGNAELNYLADFHGTSKQNIEFGENLKDYTKVTNAEEITTVLIPLGAKLKDDEGNDTDERLTVGSINGGKDYIEDTEAIAQYGRIVKVVEWDDVTEASNLLTKGREKLSELILQNVTIDLNAIDLHLLDRNIESFGYGMYIRVVSEPHNLDVNMLCNKQTINLLKPENDTVTLGYSYKSLTESATNEKREIASSTNKTSNELSNIYRDLNSKNGMFFTEEKLSDGSKIHYIHDRADLTKSAVIWKMTADSIAISTNGGRTYTYGLTADGEAVLKRIYVEGINADYIIAGKLSDKSGNNYFDLDNGKIKAGSGYIGDGTNNGMTIGTNSLVSNNMRLSSHDTLNGGSLIFDGSIDLPRCEAGHHGTGLIFRDADTGKSFGSLRGQKSGSKMYVDERLGYIDMNTGEQVDTIHLDGLTGEITVNGGKEVLAKQSWVNSWVSNYFMLKDKFVTGSVVYNNVSTTGIDITDERIKDKSYIICGTQDAGNPVLRTQKITDTSFRVFFADPVQVARINYIAF